MPPARREEIGAHLLDVRLINQQRGVDDLQCKHAENVEYVEGGGDATLESPRIVDAMHQELSACDSSRLRPAMHNFPTMQHASISIVQQKRGWIRWSEGLRPAGGPEQGLGPQHRERS